LNRGHTFCADDTTNYRGPSNQVVMLLHDVLVANTVEIEYTSTEGL